VRIYLSRLHFPITTLGPGARVGIWFQGCSIRCPGCISADTWAERRGETTVGEALDAIEPWLTVADGVTISGGEPFDQPESLEMLLRGIRRRSSVDVLVYSGHTYEKLRSPLIRMSGLIDALISDPFELNTSQTLPLRGSDNQRLHAITALGREKFARYCSVSLNETRALDVMFDEETGAVWLAGIPDRGDMKRLQILLRSSGNMILTTEDTSVDGVCRDE
jgi:anaerobic ribonucleoside-triphosphate reductase activating protein